MELGTVQPDLEQLPLARLRLDISYDGSDFSGWAVQPDRRTVAGVLVASLTQLFGPDRVSGLTVAGRTDAGVHATGQVCHLDLPAADWQRWGPTMVRRLAGLLPPDVRVRTVREVPPTFDARFSALFRTYEYRVADDPWGADPLLRNQTLAWPRELDLERLNLASAGFLGEHDFAAYAKRKEHATTVRMVTRLDWRRQADRVLVATVSADAFCQSMVRSLVGGILPAGDGRRPVEWPASLLSRSVRADEVVVAPARGLTLVEVGYPEDESEYAVRAGQTRRLRVPLRLGTGPQPQGE
jgi:tRNA pseudouridine38-40 synthase